jgi:hypothetical protein
MVEFTTILQRFEEKGEKTGWTYIEISAEIAQELNPNVKVGYRVKGKLDEFPIKLVALLPMGEGRFIIPINATMRKGIKKKEGASLNVHLEIDTDILPLSDNLLECLADEPTALAFFQSLSKSHQNYFSKWIESAKTPETKANRIIKTIKGLAMQMDYGEMIRYFKARNE